MLATYDTTVRLSSSVVSLNTLVDQGVLRKARRTLAEGGNGGVSRDNGRARPNSAPSSHTPSANGNGHYYHFPNPTSPNSQPTAMDLLFRGFGASTGPSTASTNTATVTPLSPRQQQQSPRERDREAGDREEKEREQRGQQQQSLLHLLHSMDASGGAGVGNSPGKQGMGYTNPRVGMGDTSAGSVEGRRLLDKLVRGGGGGAIGGSPQGIGIGMDDGIGPGRSSGDTSPLSASPPANALPGIDQTINDAASPGQGNRTIHSNYATPLTDYAPHPTSLGTGGLEVSTSQESAVDPDGSHATNKASGPPDVSGAAEGAAGRVVKGGQTPFDFVSPFDMLEKMAPKPKPKPHQPQLQSQRPLPQPQVQPGAIGEGFPQSATGPGGAPLSGTSIVTAAGRPLVSTDFLSGSPAPQEGSTSNAGNSPSQAPGTGLLVPTAAKMGVPSSGIYSSPHEKDDGFASTQHQQMAPPQPPQPPVATKPTKHARAQSQSGSGETPDSFDDQERELKGRYLAQLQRDSNGFTPPNSGLTLRPGPPPQVLRIAADTPNLESMYVGTESKAPTTIAITIFPSALAFSAGEKAAVNGFISYATKAGRIRVIDQSSGSRMMLKRHEARVDDMAIGQPKSLEGRGMRRWRCIASVGLDGRLVIWKVPVKFEDGTASYEVLAEVIAEADAHPAAPKREGRFTALKWHPREAATLLVSTNDGRVILLRLNQGVFAGAWKRMAPVGRPLTEAEAFEGQAVLHVNANVCAMVFSPDGSAFAFVSDDHMLTVRQTSRPAWTILSAQLEKGAPITRLEFLTDGKARPQGIIISRREGTRIDVVEIPTISTHVISIELAPPPPQVADDVESIPLFGHSAWIPAYSTLLVSNSTRGSLTAFHFDLRSSALDAHADVPEEDASYIERLASKRQTIRQGTISPVVSTLYIDHISEIPTPHAIVSFCIDAATRQPPNATSSSCSLFYITPEGMWQLHMPRDAMQPVLASPRIDERRQSLAGEILVDVQVEKAVEAVEKLTFTEPAGPALHKPDAPILSANTTPAIRGPSGANDLTGPRGRRSQAELIKGEGANWPVESGPLAMEFRKIEDNLHTRLGRLIVKEMEKSEQRLEEDRLTHQAAETARQETIFKLVSTTLMKNTSKALESTIKAEIKSTVIPAVTKIVEQALDEQIRKGMNDSMKKAIPAELEKLLFRTDISNHIARSFSSSVGPIIERNLGDAMNRSLVPAFTHIAKTMLDQLVQEVRGEMTSVRKDIVAEQSKALMGAEQELRDLRVVMETMRGQMATLQDTVKQAMVGGYAGASPAQSFQTNTSGTSVPPYHASERNAGQAQGGYPGQNQQGGDPGQQYASPKGTAAMRGPQQMQQYPSPRGNGLTMPQGSAPPPPPIDRNQTRTPPGDYEDMFLRALSDKDPAALSDLIDRAPKHRLEAVFMRDGQWGKPALSQAVVLTLAHRLSEEVLEGVHSGGPLGPYGTNRLRWIWSCVSAVDYKDAPTAQYLSRVLDLCSNCLVARQAQLTSIDAHDDAKGIAEVLRLIHEKMES